MKKGILYISDFSADHRGGFIKSLLALSEELLKQKYNLFYIFPEQKDFHNDIVKYGEVFYLNSFKGKKYDLKLMLLTTKIILQKKIKIIHTNFGLAGFLAGTLNSMLLRTKHISHERQIAPKSKLSGFLRKNAVRMTFNLLDLLSNNSYIAISNEVKRNLIEYNGYNKKKITVIHNGTQIKSVKKNGDFPTYQINVGMIAHMGPYKDHETLIKAIAVVKREIPEIQCILVGDELLKYKGLYIYKLRDLIDSLNLEYSVSIIDKVLDPSEIISTFDIGCLISKFEGFGNVAVEYMLAKKPVVASRTGGLIDIIINGETGYLIDQGDIQGLAEKIIFLAKNKTIRDQLGNKGFEIAKNKFTIENWVKNIQEYYKK